jgi:hypothetical protein
MKIKICVLLFVFAIAATSNSLAQRVCDVLLTSKAASYYKTVLAKFPGGVHCNLTFPAGDPRLKNRSMSEPQDDRWMIYMRDKTDRRNKAIVIHEFLHGWIVATGRPQPKIPQGYGERLYTSITAAISHQIIFREEAKIGFSESGEAEADFRDTQNEIESARKSGTTYGLPAAAEELILLMQQNPRVEKQAEEWFRGRRYGDKTITLANEWYAQWRMESFDTQKEIVKIADESYSTALHFQPLDVSYDPK